MAVICRQQQLLFIAVPRTGCTAVSQVLRDRLRGEDVPSEDLLDERGRYRVPQKHATLAQLLELALVTEKQRAELLVFGTVRNPFDSLVSLYVKGARHFAPLLDDPGSWVHRMPPSYIENMRFCMEHSFDEWIHRRFHVDPLRRLLGRRRRRWQRHPLAGLDAVMRYERLQDDFDAILRRSGFDARVEIPRVNVTGGRRPYRDYYSSRSRRLVEYAFSEDLRRFGYRF